MSNMLVKNDIMFQLLFGQKKYEELLIALLNAILDLPLEKRITSVILNSSFRLDKCFLDDKIGILDVRAIASMNY